MSIKSITEELFSTPPNNTLYHYTSFNGLLGIVKEKALWASDIRYLNDAAEMKHTSNLLRDEISKQLESGQGNSKLLSQFSEWLSDRITNGHMIFAASLTSNGNLLSQWRGYCPTGKGVSIGFDSKIISTCAQEQNFLVGKCIYNINKQNKIIKTIIQKTEELALSMGESTNRH